MDFILTSMNQCFLYYFHIVDTQRMIANEAGEFLFDAL